jgi:hypothetical protein
MTPAAVLPCPECKRGAGASLTWHDYSRGSCLFCQTDLEVAAFPALTRERAVAKPQAVVVSDDATCFFHAQNQADKVCDGCGRFLCAVCAIPFTGGTLCPTCVSAQRTKDIGIPNRLLLSSIALGLAVLPIVAWPTTVVTAPVALGLVIYGWRKPGSLVHGRGYVKFVLAGLVALAQIGGWIFLLVSMLKR